MIELETEGRKRTIIFNEYPKPELNNLTMEELAGQYGNLMTQIQDLKIEAGDLKEEAKKIETILMERFQNSGTQRMSVNGRTVWLQRQLWAGAEGGTAGLSEALLAEGMDEMVKEAVSTSTLSGWVREFDPDKLLSPEEIKAAMTEAGVSLAVIHHLKISEKYALRVRQS